MIVLPRYNDRYEDTYSNRDQARPKRNAANIYNGDDLSGTRVFGKTGQRKQVQPKPHGQQPVQTSSLASINISLTIIIAALIVCLVILLSIYSSLNS